MTAIQRLVMDVAECVNSSEMKADLFVEMLSKNEENSVMMVIMKMVMPVRVFVKILHQILAPLQHFQFFCFFLSGA